MDGSRYFVFECSRYVVVRGVTDGVGEFARPAVSAGRTHSALQGAAGVAVDDTVVLLHPPLPLAGVSTVMERGCQQNDSLVNG